MPDAPTIALLFLHATVDGAQRGACIESLSRFSQEEHMALSSLRFFFSQKSSGSKRIGYVTRRAKAAFPLEPPPQRREAVRADSKMERKQSEHTCARDWSIPFCLSSQEKERTHMHERAADERRLFCKTEQGAIGKRREWTCVKKKRLVHGCRAWPLEAVHMERGQAMQGWRRGKAGLWRRQEAHSGSDTRRECDRKQAVFQDT